MTNASRQIWLASLSLILFSLACSPLHAQRLSPEDAYNEAVVAFEEEEYTEALDKLEYSADEGFAEAQYQLSFIYNAGDLVPANPERARELLEAAAEQGHMRAEHQLSIQDVYDSTLELSFDGALQQFRAGDYEEAYTRFTEGAQDGHVKSMHMLARMYHLGLGPAESMSRDERIGGAVIQLGQASMRGYAPSQYVLGRLTLTLHEDTDRAIDLYARSAEQGYPEAQVALAWMYVEGNGVPQDYERAVALLQGAANQGYGPGQRTLGSMQADGVGGLDSDLVKAHMWFNLAAAQGTPAAAELREEVASDMTRSQIAEAQRLAREWEPSE